MGVFEPHQAHQVAQIIAALAIGLDLVVGDVPHIAQHMRRERPIDVLPHGHGLDYGARQRQVLFFDDERRRP